MKYQISDIIIIDFPFSDLSGSKKRPALIVSNIKGNNYILCQITSKKSNIEDYQIFISKDMKSTNLNIDSYICSDLIFTLDKNLILGKIGKIEETSITKVKQIIKKIFKI